MKRYFVTGGSGFIGSALVKRLLQAQHPVVVLDDHSRGRSERLAGVPGDLRVVQGDVRDVAIVAEASKGADVCLHLAAVNGTETFYREPGRVLDVGIKGLLAVMEGCAKSGVRELIVASSSEVYQSPAVVPTPEKVALVIPDPYNPRYSYAASKIASEMIALHMGPSAFQRVLLFRPHNVFGPDMGTEHVIPQLTLKAALLARAAGGEIALPIHGDGSQTRSFIYIDDFVEAFMLMVEHGEHVGIYHLGTEDEVRIDHVAELICASLGRRCRLVKSPSPKGETIRRCPDIAKIRALGFRARVPLREGVAHTAQWYAANVDRWPARQ
jgi:dTDP-glucose 4,6-dehydratase/UDP-glucose 4-epimerase